MGNKALQLVQLIIHHDLDLYLNIALDGYGKTHDRIRCVPQHLEKTLDCIEAIYPLKEKYADRLRLNVNTVICEGLHRNRAAGGVHVVAVSPRWPVF